MHRNANALSLAALILLFCWPSAPVIASDWQFVVRHVDGSIFSADVASLTRDGNIVRAWTRVVYAEPLKSGDDKYWSARVREYYDCAERRVAVKQLTTFVDKEFKKVLLSSQSTDDALLEWDDVAPDTVIEVLLEFVCSKAPKQ